MSELRTKKALIWCLRHGVQAVNYCKTGYWSIEGGPDGTEVMPPADIMIELSNARDVVLAVPETEVKS